MSIMGRLGVGGSLAALLLVGVWIWVVGRDTNTSAATTAVSYMPRLQQVHVTVAPATRQSLDAEFEFTGNLLPRRVTRVMAEVEGIVYEVPQVGAQIDVEVDGRHYSERLGIGYGQQVSKGDVLVWLDTRDAEVGLRIAEAKLAKAQADLGKLKAWQRPEEVQRLTALRDEAQSRHQHAISDYHRTESLVQRNAATKSEYEKAALEVATLRAVLEASEASLAVAQAGPMQEEIAVQRALIAQAEAEVEQHRRTLDKAVLRAPYDSVVTAYHVEVGDRVTPAGGPVVELMDIRYLSAEIAVPEAYVGRLTLEDRARVEAAGSTGPVPGMVIAVNEFVDPQTRTFQVRVAIDNEQRKFKAGQFARVRLTLGSGGDQRLAVPRESVVFMEGQPHVFLLRDDTVHQTSVTIGVSSATAIEIQSGLAAGDKVVVDDPSLLADGMKVSVRQELDSLSPRGVY
ncbi:MAG: efflux RND transporter periplasmic adaptor subunit [Planctomycetaceae bacterium]|nr:MAG: efflux RND transporter periplasmic adaptor subunit [Planctomycetaceae bacterium]